MTVVDETKDHLHDEAPPPTLAQTRSGSKRGSSLLERVRSWVSGEGWGGKHGHMDEDDALDEMHKRIREAGSEYAAWLEPVWEDKLRRVLRARNHDVDAAYLMWHNLAKWRAEYRPDQLTEADAQWYLSKKVIYSIGRDKDGRPATYVHGKMHVADHNRIDDMVKTIVYLFERDTNESVRTADGKIVMMFDANGSGLRNMDTKLFVGKKGFVHILQDYYPETLSQCFIINGTWIFKMMWKVIAPFLDEKTRHKVVVVDKLEELLNHFEYDSLPEQVRKDIKRP